MVDRGDYIQFDELEKYGVCVIYTKKTYGNVMKMEKDKFIRDFSLGNRKVVAGHQTHSDNIVIIEDIEQLYFEDTDGFMTDRKDIVIYTKYGDCLPIYIYDRKKQVISTVHAGWQGTFKEIGIKGINLMKERYQSKIEDIIVLFGVGICQNRYEVGEEFLDKFSKKFSKDLIENSFIFKDERIYFDNQKFNYFNMLKYGVKEKNIITNDLCTYNGHFHSYRREREKSGRNGSFVWFK